MSGMAIVDSVAAFSERAKYFGIEQTDLEVLVRKKAASFGAFAWVATFNPSSTDDGPLKTALRDILERDPTVLDMSRFRRLHFESHAIAVSDARIRVERTDEAPARKLPAPERAARYQEQKDRLTGLVWNLHLEPSHALLDKVQAQVEENMPSYIEPELCTSRNQELSGIKRETSAKIDSSSGILKLTKEEVPEKADTQSDYNLRLAFRRRALAYDQSSICSYEVMEMWSEKLFGAMAEVPPPGYNPPSRAQILAADKQLFAKICEKCRNGVLPTTIRGNITRPIEDALEKFEHDVTVTFHLLPLPSGTPHRVAQSKAIDKEMEDSAANDGRGGKGWASRRQSPYGGGKGKGGKGGKSGKNGKSGGKKLPYELKGCWTHVKGKQACPWFNLAKCRSKTKPGDNCNLGIHLCMAPGCGEPHPAITCPKRQAAE